MDSFYNVFSFSDLYLDGGNKTINMDGVKITKDIPELGLKKGATYHTCWFKLDKGVFHFINWESKPNWGWPECGDYNPDPSRSLEIKQSDLAPFLLW